MEKKMIIRVSYPRKCFLCSDFRRDTRQRDKKGNKIIQLQAGLQKHTPGPAVVYQQASKGGCLQRRGEYLM